MGGTDGSVTRDELVALAAEHGFTLSADELEVAHDLVAGAVAATGQLVAAGATPGPAARAAAVRRWRWPTPEEDPHNAWVTRCEIAPTGGGRLDGLRVAAKDNVQVAGLPMTNGSRVLQGYVAEVDATVVTRLLANGATLVGTTRCEQFCMSDGSHTGLGGPVHNPHRHGHTSGGSSSGSAVAVATGQVDIAIGGDQGGSIRIPAAYCGVVGMKPTWGLVPYTGICRMEPHIDHAGPITADVRTNALALEVMAGADGVDPHAPVAPAAAYDALIDEGVGGLRIGVLEQGFSHPRADGEVMASVRAAADRLAAAGADVVDVSVPEHAGLSRLGLPVMVQGLYRTVLHDGGQGVGRPDVYLPELHRRMRRWREHGQSLSAAMKVTALIGAAVDRRHGALPYQLAVNHARRAREAVDAALRAVDVLLLPTALTTAPRLPGEDAGFLEQFVAATAAITNTFPFDLTHHPALSVPCGSVDGLPVGVMLVGRHLDEATLYRAGAAVEATA